MFLPPRRLTICHMDIVHGCQLRCVGCPNSTILAKVQRTPVEAFAQYLAHLDVDRIELLRLFNFGEPLLHHDLPGILRAVATSPFEVGVVEISTNAQWVDWEQLEAALRLGVLGRLAVSCDGDGTPGSYEALRPPGRWSKLVEFLERARDLASRVAPGLDLVTRTVVEDAASMRRWERILEPRGWRPEFRGWLPMVGAARAAWLPAPTPGRGVCEFLGADQLYVDWDGAVVPCCAHPRAGVLGDLRHQSFRTIVSGAPRRSFRRTLRDDRRSLATCGSCEFGAFGLAAYRNPEALRV